MSPTRVLLALCVVLFLSCGDEPEPREEAPAAGGQGGGGTSGDGPGGHGGSGGEGGSGGSGGIGGEGGSGGSGGIGGTDAVMRLTPVLAGIVDPYAATQVRSMLQMTGEHDLPYVADRFYEVFPDDFDFLFFFSEFSAGAYGVHLPINRPAIEGTGIEWALQHPSFASRRLKSAISLRLGDNGPTLHETAHHWAVYLDQEFGFEYGHWGFAGVRGQLGGFDPETLFCDAPPGSRPPCEPDDEGLMNFVVGQFGTNANGGDSVPYALIELYLMGLLPPEEVPPFPMLRGVVSNERGAPGTRLIRAETHEVITIDDLISRHGLRPLATAEERAFRAAFVLVTEDPPTPEQIDQANGWAASFGCVNPDRWTLCFDDATQGLATMDVLLP